MSIIERWFAKSGVVFHDHSSVSSVDYEATVGGRVVGFCVATNKSNLYMIVGRLVGAGVVFSDVVLVAPTQFLRRVMKISENIVGLRFLGYATIKDGGLSYIKRPTPEKYYFKGVVKDEQKRRFFHVTENDLKILEYFEGNDIMVTELAKKLKTTINNSYAKLRRLKRLGLVKEVEGGYPKVYEIITKRGVGEKTEAV